MPTRIKDYPTTNTSSTPRCHKNGYDENKKDPTSSSCRHSRSHKNDTTIPANSIILFFEDEACDKSSSSSLPTTTNTTTPRSNVIPTPKPGPNQLMYYQSNYPQKIQRILQNHRRTSSHNNTTTTTTTKEYRKMEPWEQQQMQSKVANLLSRLSIHNNHKKQPNSSNSETGQLIMERSTVLFSPNNTIFKESSFRMEDDNLPSPEQSRLMLTPSSQQRLDPPTQTAIPSSTTTRNTSTGTSPLLREQPSFMFTPGTRQTPSPNIDPTTTTTTTALGQHLNRSIPLYDGSDSESSTVESRTRSTLHFQSPADELLSSNKENLRKKRMASVSGRKGSDASRFKTGTPPDISARNLSSPPSFSPQADLHWPVNNDDDPGDSVTLFSASQSPVASSTLTATPIFAQKYTQMDDTSLEKDDINEDSIVEYTMAPSEEKSSSLHNISSIYGLKGAQRPVYQPLKFQKSKGPTKSDSDFDTFAHLDRNVRNRLHSSYTEILTRWDNGFPSILLGLSFENFTSILLKIITSSNRSSFAKNSTGCRGKNLFVFRDSVALSTFARALRERTNLSVLDHTSTPSSERRSPSSSAFCSQFDVVLTTYDLLKEQNIALPVNTSTGIVDTQHQVEAQNTGGWIDSTKEKIARSYSHDVKRLSVLHSLSWERAIFLDEPGRKSYLVKGHTARWNAARTLDSRNSLYFMDDSPSSNEKSSFSVTDLLRSDRRARESLETLLSAHCGDDLKGDEFVLQHFVLDCNR